MANDNGITSAILLQHMQAMELRLLAKIGGVETGLKSDIQRVEAKVDKLEMTVDRNHALVTAQLDNIDARLDDLEIVQVPTLKKAVGMR